MTATEPELLCCDIRTKWLTKTLFEICLEVRPAAFEVFSTEHYFIVQLYVGHLDCLLELYYIVVDIFGVGPAVLFHSGAALGNLTLKNKVTD